VGGINFKSIYFNKIITAINELAMAFTKKKLIMRLKFVANKAVAKAAVCNEQN